MSSLFVLIPGFGAPNLNIKKQILRHNLDRINETKWSKLVVRVCVYDDSDVSDICGIDVVRSHGIVGQFIKTYAAPDDVQGFDFVMILLDDVLLQPSVKFDKIIALKNMLRLDIVSPSLSLDSQYVYRYMLTRPNAEFDVKISAFCELFCFFMDINTYKKYYEYIDGVHNPWMWGLDLILHYVMGFNVGILNNMSMKHFFYQTCYRDHPEQDPIVGFNYTLQKYNIEDKSYFQRVPCELYLIKESFCTL